MAVVSRLRPALLLLVLAAAGAAAAAGQGPDAAWRTLATPHFRLHYPAPFDAWARRAAVWLEAVRERDIAEIGFTPADTVDVVIGDPRAEDNGEAVPLRGWPRLVLWTSPPPPDSETGHFRDWIEDLVVHEEAHLVHLLRPSRNPLLAKVMPVSTIALAPRWVIEGYATLVEGRLTGAGRPNGDLRAAILRRWAQAGLLPSYARLAADAHAWRGMSMAYLVGSAYLEWLEQRGGKGSLQKLWARLTARSPRGFDDAFSGIWGSAPESLYDRFRAELTWRAMEVEHRVQAVGPLAVREGALWQWLTWTTGAPALSPDGGRLALVRRFRDRPAELVVWSTAPDAAAEKRWHDAQAELVRRDPQDVPAVLARPLPRVPLASWAPADGGAPTAPRFLPDGRSLLAVRFLPDGEGVLHPDLFQWWPDGGRVRRVTRQADVRDADPAPDGRWAVAVRDRHGLSQLVAIDLASGAVRPLTEPTVDTLYDRPRLSPDGRRIACGLHAGGGWRVAILALSPDRSTATPLAELAPPTGASVSSPAWSPDGRTLYAVVGSRGFLDVYSFDAAEDAPRAFGPAPSPRALTRMQGAALAPAPTPDGKGLFFLSLEPDGLSVHRLDLAAAAARPTLPEVAAPPDLAPAVRPAPPAAPPPLPAAAFRPAPPAPSPAPPGAPAGRPYGLGRLEWLPVLGGTAANAASSLEAGMRAGDLIGRLDLLALGGFGDAGAWRGGTVAGSFRGWPADIAVQLFDVREAPSLQAPSAAAAAAAAGLDLERRGLGVTTGWDHQGDGDQLRLAASLLWMRLGALDGTTPASPLAPAAALAGDAAETSLATSAAYRIARRYGLFRIASDVAAHLDAGRTAGDDWARYGLGAALALVHHADDRLLLRARRDGSRQVSHAVDLYQLGGADTGLLPAAALDARIVSPALPAAALLGAEHEEERIDLDLALLPVPLFWERHRLWGGLLPRAMEMTLAGAEYRVDFAPYPLGRLPGFELRAGAARVFADPLRDGTRFWLVSVVRP